MFDLEQLLLDAETVLYLCWGWLLAGAVVWALAPVYMCSQAASSKGYSSTWGCLGGLFFGWWALFYYASLGDRKTSSRIDQLTATVMNWESNQLKRWRYTDLEKRLINTEADKVTRALHYQWLIRDELPYVQFQNNGNDHALCQFLNRKCWPIEDSGWWDYLPSHGSGCQCSVLGLAQLNGVLEKGPPMAEGTQVPMPRGGSRSWQPLSQERMSYSKVGGDRDD